MAERGWGKGKGEDEVCQRSLCGLGRDVGDHPRRNAAGIRFYADEGGAGNHPRRNAAGIRFYADEGGAGNHPRRNAAGIHGEAASTVARVAEGNHLREEPTGIRGEVSLRGRWPRGSAGY